MPPAEGAYREGRHPSLLTAVKGGYSSSVTTTDRITIMAVGVGVITAIGTGACFSAGRMDDLRTDVAADVEAIRADIREVRGLVIEALRDEADSAPAN